MTKDNNKGTDNEIPPRIWTALLECCQNLRITGKRQKCGIAHNQTKTYGQQNLILMKMIDNPVDKYFFKNKPEQKGCWNNQQKREIGVNMKQGKGKICQIHP